MRFNSVLRLSQLFIYTGVVKEDLKRCIFINDTIVKVDLIR